jgi:pimeloyl-ACP methyl ester carboxylesterase
MNIQECNVHVDNVFESKGWATHNLADYNLPIVELAPDGDNAPVPYVVFGTKVKDAPYKILEISPYATELDSPHYQLRLGAQQDVLGPEYCIIGVQAYDPVGQTLSSVEKVQMAAGNFSPLSTRVLRVAKHLGLDKNESNYVYGYSLGADVAIQTASELLGDANRGVVPLKSLGAVEAARVSDRGAMAVMKAMKASGNDLFENILGSRAKALTEAWGIEDTARAEKHRGFDGRLMAGMAKYWLGSLSANIAITKGFGTEQSLLQASLIVVDGLPTFIGRQKASSVCPESFITSLESLGQPNLVTLQEKGDHSADDNIRRSAARILYFISATA